jgi:hypothetical protein
MRVVVGTWADCPDNGIWSVWDMAADAGLGLPEGWTRAPVGDLINAVATELRPALTNLDGAVFGPGGTDWAAALLAERNPYTSDFLCSVAGAVALVRHARAFGDVFVVTDDPTLGAALAETCRLAGLSVQWARPARWGGTARVWGALIRGWAREMMVLRRHGLGADRLPSGGMWLLTWAGPDVFPAGQPLQRDRFFGGLPGWLHESGIPFGIVGNPTGWLGGDDATARTAALAGDPAVLIPALTGLWDRMRAAWAAWRLPAAMRSSWVLAGISVAPMVARAIEQERRSGVAARALLFAAIGRQGGRAPDVVLYPYENQPWEKQLIAGFRRHCPSTRLIGFQHSPFADRYLSADPSRRQLAENLFPDVLVASGSAFRDRLRTCGVPESRIVVGGALRSPDLAGPVAAPRRCARLARVLASLPMQAGESVDLAAKAVAACAGLAVDLVVNFHPMLDSATRSRIRALVGEGAGAAANVEFSDAPARALLPETDLLLYNSSGTVFEAAALGIASIYVGPEAGLDLDKLPGGNPWGCRSAGELRRMLAALEADPAPLAAHAVALASCLGSVFAPPDREVWLNLLTPMCDRQKDSVS